MFKCKTPRFLRDPALFADARGRTGHENDAYPQADYLLQLLAVARAVNAGEIAQQCADSTAIAAAVQRARIRAIEALVENSAVVFQNLEMTNDCFHGCCCMEQISIVCRLPNFAKCSFGAKKIVLGEGVAAVSDRLYYLVSTSLTSPIRAPVSP